jgi:predicted dehydrogenase
VIGVGRLGAEHARLLKELPGSKLVGVYDVDAERGRAVAERIGTHSFAQLSPLLEAAEGAVIAVPTRAHLETAQVALEAGCHTLVEKPLARTLEEADRLVSLADACRVVLGVGHVERFNGVLMGCEPYIDRPRFIESLRLAPFQPRGTDVTVILDLMIHDIDLVLGLVRGRVVEVRAVGVPVVSSSVDIANARLAFEDGTVANITASRVSARPLRQLRLFQSSGYFSLDLRAGRGEFLRRGSDPLGVAGGPEDLVDRVEIAAAQVEPLRLELEAFLQAIRGEASRLVTAREGRRALAVALEITREIEEFADVVAQDS